MYSELDIITTVKSRLSIDKTLFNHSHNVGVYAMGLYDLFRQYNIIGIQKYNSIDFLYTGFLHDVGKLLIEPKILNAPRKLSEYEFTLMKLHPSLGEDYLSSMFPLTTVGLVNILDGVRYHHECWNGSGYSEGLKGDDIPLIARVVSICDVFDALTSFRPYKVAFSFNEAIDILKAGSGTLFDPLLIEILVANLDYLKKLSLNVHFI